MTQTQMATFKELLHQAELNEIFNSENFLKDADLYEKVNPRLIRGEK